MTLRTKLSSLLLILVVLPFIILGQVSYRYVINAEQYALNKNMQHLLKKTQNTMQLHIQIALNDIQLLSQDAVIKDYMTQPKKPDLIENTSAVLARFKQFIQTHAFYYEARVVDAEGLEKIRYVIDELATPNWTKNEQKLNYFQQMKISGNKIDYFALENPDNNELAFLIGFKFYTRGKISSYLLLTLRPQFLFDTIEQHSPEQQASLILSHQQGKVFSQPPHSPFYQASNSQQMVQALIQEWQAQEKTQSVWKTSLFGKQQYIMGRVLNDELYLFAVLPEKTLIADAQQLSVEFFIISLISLAICIGLMYIILNKEVVQPIQRLANATQAVKAGQLHVRLKHPQDDEIGVLYWQFNRMMERMQQAVHEVESMNMQLEEKVKERTASLERTNQALTIARQQADTANHAKSEFIANISHELRTPMNGILGMTDMILGHQITPDLRQQMNVIHDSGQTLLVLINELLDVSDLETGRMTLNTRPFDLQQMLHEAIALLHSIAKEKGLQVITHFDEDMPSYVLGDNQRLRQIVLNLLMNAVKFTEQGHIELYLNKLPHSTPDNIEIKITITDTGIGISEEKQEYLFESFNPLENVSTRAYRGAGLGLYICYQLIQLMNGKIGVQSKPGEGSEFWFTVPLAVPDYLSEPQQAANALNAVLPDPGLQLQQKHILVVEDNRVNQMVAGLLLQRLGYKVSMANNGQEALNSLKHHLFDAVLMDVQMPVLDGLSATRLIREQEKHTQTHLPIIAMTANASDTDQKQCLLAGMDVFMQKPVTQTLLKDVLEQWLPHKEKT